MPFSKRPIYLNNKAYDTLRDNKVEIHMSTECPHCINQEIELLQMDKRFINLIKFPENPLKGVKGYPSIIIFHKNKNIIIMGHKNKEYILKLASILDN
jgi:hypothetical protein